jgi:tetratricopeptide (TPR) repeat protein
LAAAASARSYGQDIILEATMYRELGYTYARLQKWAKAEEYCDRALEILPRSEDPGAYASYYALVLSVMSNIHYQKGQHFAFQGEFPQARSEYKAAYGLVQREIKILEGFTVESEDLVIAYGHAGDFLLASTELSDGCDEETLEIVCQYWQTALEMAHRLNITFFIQEFSEHLDQHCREKPVETDS